MVKQDTGTSQYNGKQGGNDPDRSVPGLKFL